MLDKNMEAKMKEYNKLRRKADDLQSEIEEYLNDNYGIDESSYTGSIENPYSMDGVCPIYEWGERYFDIKQIKLIIDYIEGYRNRIGESPDIEEVANYFTYRKG